MPASTRVCRSCDGEGGICDGEGDLPEVVKEALLSKDIAQSLHAAISCWEELVKKLEQTHTNAVSSYSMSLMIDPPFFSLLLP